MKRTLLYILGLLSLSSCSQSGKQTIKKDMIKKDSIISKPTVTVKANDTLTIPKVTIPGGTIQVSENHLNTTSKINLLHISSYNKDDVDPKVAKLNWKGLFYNKEDFYIKSARLKFVQEHSEMDEEEGQKTGWRLESDNKDFNIVLINGPAGLINGPVKKALLSTSLYYVGQKLEFNYYGINYTLYTTGTKRYGKIYNYKLFLLANVKGHCFNQQLYSLRPDIALDGGGDMSESVEIEFAGDLDGDKIPDFIIERSGYSYGDTYLYLSKPAGDKAILKQVSSFGVSD
jgi:hypothetical protein